MTRASWSPERGLEPSPDEARRWLEQELQGSDYGEPLLDQALRWILEQLRSILDNVNNLAGGGLSPVITVLVALMVVALLVWVVPRVRRERVVASPDGAVLDDPTITPGTYRQLAARALAEGRYDKAVLDGFRAIAKDMSDRTLLDDAPSRTAHEVSLALAPTFPGHADRLASAANVFDAVRYGHRRAGADQADDVLQLDRELTKARPALATSPLQDQSV